MVNANDMMPSTELSDSDKENSNQVTVRSEALFVRIRRRVEVFKVREGLDDKTCALVQIEIARLVSLLRKIEYLLHRSKNPLRRKWLKSLVKDVDFALTTLEQPLPQAALAKDIRITLERIVYQQEYPCLWFVINRFNDAYRSESTPLKVLCGLLLALPINLLFTTVIVLVLSILQVALQFAKADEAKMTAQNSVNMAMVIQQISNPLQGLNLQFPARGSAPANNPQPEPSPSDSDSTKNSQAETSLSDSIKNQEHKLAQARERQSDLEKSIKFFTQVGWVILAGTLGSIVSILIRIEDFQDKQYRDRAIPFLIGCFKPIIGASFSVFFFALISAELVQIPGVNAVAEIPVEKLTDEQIAAFAKNQSTDSTKEASFIFAIAFLVGFSERLATDAISKLEDAVGGNSPDAPSPRKSSVIQTTTVEAVSLTESSTVEQVGIPQRSEASNPTIPPREAETEDSSVSDRPPNQPDGSTS